MPAIDFLMNSLDTKPTDLDRIVAAQGPGSYTGLRIAVATAKTLAHTLTTELVGVSQFAQLLVPEQVEGLVISSGMPAAQCLRWLLPVWSGCTVGSSSTFGRGFGNSWRC